MPDARPLVNGTDSAVQRSGDFRSWYGKTPARLSDLEAERDVLREMVKQAKAREMFFRFR
jgi:hypothetical protein